MLLIPLCASAGEPPVERPEATAREQYVDDLVRRAFTMDLHRDRYWHILLHYRKTVSGVKSYIDTPGFFLAEGGKSNPAAELEATIRSFFDPEIPPDRNMTGRFIARYTWLKEQLKIDERMLPYPPSTQHWDTIREIDPESMTLVFPAGYINNPASMFGHTFLLIERKNKSRLLAFSVNYQAHATESKGFAYAIKGLIGLYKGFFDVMPYYEKVEQYSDMDKREMWEYPLRLDRHEMELLLLHLFEMNRIYSDYYYLDENCSFSLLFLLEAAKPSARLFDRLNITVTPIETLKAVVESGLVDTPRYRPSKTSKIMHLEKQARPEHLQFIKDTVRGKHAPEDILSLDISNDEKILLSDLLSEYIDYTYTERQLDKKEYVNLYRRALKVRSTLGSRERPYEEIKRPTLPETTHEAYRVSSGYRYRNDNGADKSMVLLNFRATYHNLIDAEEGFDEGSQIIFGDLSLRYNITDNAFALEKLDVINLMCVVPRSHMVFPFSWKARTGFMQRIGNDGDEHLIYNGNLGGGFAWRLPLLNITYIMTEGDIDVGPSRNYWANAGAGLSIGFINRLASWYKVHYFFKAGYFAITEQTLYLQGMARNNFMITRDFAIFVDYEYRRNFDSTFHDVTVSANYYF